MASKIKISRPGYDVDTTPDNGLIFNSDYPLFKINKQGSGQVRLDTGGRATVTIPHDVGKIPMYFVKGEFTDSSTTKASYLAQYPVSIYLGLGVYAYHIVKPFKDKIQIIYYVPNLPNAVMKFIYYIFEDPIIL
jgi:hypothetical protein